MRDVTFTNNQVRNVTGTLSAANVLGPASQGVPAGDFQAIVDALQSDTAYANIHTTAFPAGVSTRTTGSLAR